MTVITFMDRICISTASEEIMADLHISKQTMGYIFGIFALSYALFQIPSGWFADTALDGVFISRFGNDFLVYQQSRMGYTVGSRESRTQLYWNANLTVDDRREDWANFWETGPGVRFAGGPLPRSAYFTVNLLRGSYLIRGRAAYTDVRVGFWYAITR